MLVLIIFFSILQLISAHESSYYSVYNRAQNIQDYVLGILVMIPIVLTILLSCAVTAYLIYVNAKRKQDFVNLI
jgi:hypothetical protein